MTNLCSSPCEAEPPVHGCELRENVENAILSNSFNGDASVSGSEYCESVSTVDSALQTETVEVNLRKRRAFGVKSFVGHADIICCAVMDRDILISARYVLIIFDYLFPGSLIISFRVL
jgi:hypothetical protein